MSSNINLRDLIEQYIYLKSCGNFGFDDNSIVQLQSFIAKSQISFVESDIKYLLQLPRNEKEKPTFSNADQFLNSFLEFQTCEIPSKEAIEKEFSSLLS
eukprot:TRINITY_DN2863_c1_g3_i1.p1 TRINITY_DN2863_c1_g3~~TRINITY_DN2863_c1_g3_i1.p1  ORF type:complete len:99 (+),score=22.62 TRINITY_DN2863_c1_g3_i1:41-337(+)